MLCGHAIILSRPLLPPLLSNFTPGYEGELMLLAGSQYRELRVQQPRRLGAEGSTAVSVTPPGWDVVADASTMTVLNRMLPATDLALKVSSYIRCGLEEGRVVRVYLDGCVGGIGFCVQKGVSVVMLVLDQGCSMFGNSTVPSTDTSPFSQ
jgi:hypothetical protein